AITLRIHPGQGGEWFQGGRPRRPGRRGRGDPTAPARPDRSAAPDPPAGPHRRPRCPLEPPPRETPHPAGTPDRAPSSAVAARLNPGPVGRRARASAFAPVLLCRRRLLGPS